MSDPTKHVLISYDDVESAFIGRLEKVAPTISSERHHVTYRLTEKGLEIGVSRVDPPKVGP